MNARFYFFADFRLYAAGKVLYRHDERVPLTPKALETLLLLVEKQGDVVEKDELLRRVWPDTFVEEISLTRNISVLRKTLANGGRTRIHRNDPEARLSFRSPCGNSEGAVQRRGEPATRAIAVAPPRDALGFRDRRSRDD